MDRIPASAPIIPSLPKLEKRPLWSVMIPVYNCAQFIPEVLESVLMQDPGEELMQIEVVDDASTDADIKELVQRIGKGRILYFRQEKNVGSLRNFESCINRSQGALVHILHGDDKVKLGFYAKIGSLFKRFPEAGAAFSSYSFINENGKRSHDHFREAQQDGILENWLIRIAEQQRIQYAAMVVRREVYENLGSFYGVSYGEDWEMWVRIARHYPVAYSPEVLAYYRGHSGSLTWDKAVSGKIFQDLLQTMELIERHLPEKDRGRTMEKARKHCANYLIGIANGIWKSSFNFSMARGQIKLAMEFSKTPIIYLRVAKFYTKFTRDSLCLTLSRQVVKQKWEAGKEK